MKAYSIESAYCFPPQALMRALDAPSHVRQASIYLLAPNKKAAAELADEYGMHLTKSRREVHQMDGGGFTDELLGEFGDQPGMYAMKLDAREGDAVLRVTGSNTSELVGRVVRFGRGRAFERV